MSYHSKKPSLPSIQFILEDQINNTNSSNQHSSSSLVNNNHKEYSTLPSELQRLSISAPIHEHKWSKRPSNASHSRSVSDLTTIKPLITKSHRRSISVNISTHQQEVVERSLTESPPITLKQINESSQQKLLLDALNIPSEIKRDEETGKYYCPYCQKSFNRPSSLKIHTYSHTGEKPFICPINGCGRQFSVQSNMRRHLKIHNKKLKIKK